MRTAKYQLTHGMVANAPSIMNVDADSPVLATRLFIANGPPSSTTLLAGNGKYCGSNSGFVCNATLTNAGTGYKVGDSFSDFTADDGDAVTQPIIIADAVSATGAIQDFHFSQIGNFSTFPTNPITPSGGTGTLAQFSLAIQPADFYLDADANALYVCTEGGTNSTSVWQKISGSGGGNYNYRGLWSATPASPYMTFDVVQFGAGTGAGMYLSTIDNNPNQPDTGIGWTQVSSSSGTWL